MLRLIRNQVGIEPIWEADVSKGGIIIPTSAKTRCKQGIVKQLGPEVERLKIGDYCLFSAYDGSIVAFGSGDNVESMIIMPEDAVDCTVEIEFDIFLSDARLSYKELMKQVAAQFQATTLPFVAKERRKL
jgi:Co-chaperonin GroES (HSP10)